MKNSRFLISESEKIQILSLYDRHIIDESIVITNWLSPDEKYCIFLDDLIDIENKIKIGNIWENFDYFKFFLKHSFEVAKNVPQVIKESVLNSLNSFVITESNQNMVGLKPYVKELMEQWTANPFDSEFYTAKNWSNAYESGKNVAASAWEGLKKTYSNIKDGEWKEAFKIIGQGMLYVARKIRSALYNPIGIILDAILIATQIGKGFQFVVWAVVVLLDVYEFVSGDFEEKDLSLPWRLLFFGVDILGMVTAGAAAKAAKMGVTPLVVKYGKSSEGFSKAVKNSPQLKTISQKIYNSLSSANGYIQKASSHLQKNSPKMYNFFSGPIKFFGKILSKLLKILGDVLSLPGKVVTKLAPKSIQNTKFIKGTAAAANQVVPMAGVHFYGQYKTNQEMENIAKSLEQSETKPIYDPNEI
jgi:hypothetical protein